MTNTNETAATFTTCPKCHKVVNVKGGKVARHLVVASWQHQLLRRNSGTRRVCSGSFHTVAAK